jgi:hypothetical protein
VGEGREKRSKLLWLGLFGGLYALLFVVLAVTVGFGSPTIPAGAAAVIEGAPPGAEVITEKELRQAASRQAKLVGGEVPGPGTKELRLAREQALSELITVTWLAGQAEELGLRVGSNQNEMSLSLLQEKVMAALTEEAPEPKNPQPYFTAIDFRFPAQWLPRTRCRDGLVVEQCGNYVSGHVASPCFEAQPSEPVEGCPAPVQQRVPAEPGTVTEEEPWGFGLPQGPLPG